jgi:hypothetical protein
MSYKQITLLLKLIHSLKPTIELLNLIDSLNVSPARLLIFNHLWNILSIK